MSPFASIVTILLMVSISCSIVNCNRVLELNEKFLDIYPKDKQRTWLIKFYAPWCHHCRTLEPVWAQVAQQLHSSDSGVFVGRVDCTRYTSIATHFSVKGFPTILLINADKKVEYRGDRSRDEIIDFAIRLNGPNVRKISNCDELDALRRKHDIYFTYIGEDLWSNYSLVANELQPTNWFYHLRQKCDNINEDGVYVIKKGVDALIKYENNSDISLLEWAKYKRFPQFIKVTNGNFHLLLQTGKLLVIALLEEHKEIGKLVSSKHQEFYDVAEAIAITYDDEEKFLFGWSPQLDLINSIAIRTISPLPNLIIINSTSLQYYLVEDELLPQNVIKLLNDIKQSASTLTPLGGDHFTNRVHRLLYDGFTSFISMYQGNPILTILLFGLPLAFLSIIIYTSCFSDILDAKEDEDSDDEQHEAHENHAKQD